MLEQTQAWVAGVPSTSTLGRRTALRACARCDRGFRKTFTGLRLNGGARTFIHQFGGSGSAVRRLAHCSIPLPSFQFHSVPSTVRLFHPFHSISDIFLLFIKFPSMFPSFVLPQCPSTTTTLGVFQFVCGIPLLGNKLMQQARYSWRLTVSLSPTLSVGQSRNCRVQSNGRRRNGRA